mmetsp:Transcript_1952/g.5387  ORF Transcript_1952/g.5387 Transcript_1952/m.5387 type:complete len:227 (+) Transcript_1952:302-982(+)
MNVILQITKRRSSSIPRKFASEMSSKSISSLKFSLFTKSLYSFCGTTSSKVFPGNGVLISVIGVLLYISRKAMSFLRLLEVTRGTSMQSIASSPLSIASLRTVESLAAFASISRISPSLARSLSMVGFLTSSLSLALAFAPVVVVAASSIVLVFVFVFVFVLAFALCRRFLCVCDLGFSKVVRDDGRRSLQRRHITDHRRPSTCPPRDCESICKACGKDGHGMVIA